jgi:hypothetical protein
MDNLKKALKELINLFPKLNFFYKALLIFALVITPFIFALCVLLLVLTMPVVMIYMLARGSKILTDMKLFFVNKTWVTLESFVREFKLSKIEFRFLCFLLFSDRTKIKFTFKEEYKRKSRKFFDEENEEVYPSEETKTAIEKAEDDLKDSYIYDIPNFMMKTWPNPLDSTYAFFSKDEEDPVPTDIVIDSIKYKEHIVSADYVNNFYKRFLKFIFSLKDLSDKDFEKTLEEKCSGFKIEISMPQDYNGKKNKKKFSFESFHPLRPIYNN